MRGFRFVLCLTSVALFSNAFATSVIMDEAYYYPEIPKILAETIDFEDYLICIAAYDGALDEGALVSSSNLVTDSYGHFDFWRASSEYIDYTKAKIQMTDADEKYFLYLLVAGDDYVYSNQDIMVLVKHGLGLRPSHYNYVYNTHFESCKAKVEGAISKWLSAQKNDANRSEAK